jgi:dienelactone hydrolase
MRIRYAATALVAGLMLSACGGSTSDSIGPTDPNSGNGNPGPPPAGVGAFRARFQPSAGVLPYPTDLYFSGTSDGTLNLPSSIASFTPHFAAMNALDGYSTTADITLRFSGPISAASLAANVRVIRVSIDNATKATTGVLGILQPGVDYSIGVSPDIDTAGATMLIRPLRPLIASSGATNNGYLVLVSNGVLDTAGHAATPDSEYLNIRDTAIADIVAGLATPACATLTNPTFNGICRLTWAHLRIGASLPGGLAIAPGNVIASWSFSTESIRDTLGFLAATTTARPYTVTASAAPFDTTAFMGLPGIVKLYNGTLNVSYYLSVPTVANPTAVLTRPWQAAGCPGFPGPCIPGLDPASRNLTRFNPVPAPTTALDIPMLIAVPDIGVKPAAGWPVVVWMHGFPRDRTDALLVADTMASRGFATIAIDLPLHGITPDSAAYAQPFAQTPIERTFNLDFQTNGQLGVPAPPGGDGVDTTGVNFLNLANALVQRDNARQGVADNIALIRTIPTIDIDPATNPGADFDGSRIHVIGYSLGATHAGNLLGLLGAEVKASALPSAAVMLTEVIQESVTYRPIINALLAAQGIQAGTTLYRTFFRNLQAAFDSADVVNYAPTIAGPPGVGRSVFLSVFEGGVGGFLTDQTVPVSSTQRLINTVGGTGVARVNAVGTTIVAGTNGGYVPFSQGIHNSLLDPGPAPQATFELQREIADFFLSNGGNIVISDGSVIAP